MPIIGNLMLLAWPLVMLILFARLRLQHAVIWSILGGYLLLPERLGWNLPMIPNLDKHSIPALTAIGLTMLYLYRRRPGTLRARGIQDRQPPPYTVLKGWLPRSPAGLLLLGMIVLGAIASVLTNGDRLVYGPTVIPGLRPYDAMSSLAVIGFTLMPLLLGRKLLADNDSHRTLIFILCYAAMAYSLLALWEIRMSPRLNFQIYGFFPHSWIQHIRGDGFRPLVFLRHGLLLGVFMACGILAAAVCMRLDQKRRTLFLLATFWLLGTLALSKTLGAFLIALALLPVVVLMPVRLQLVAAAIVAGITLSYPILRGAGWIPVDRISEIAMSYDEGRAGSLIFRLENEDILLEKANERPIFGWGGWGRWRVYDDRTGNDVSTSDGSWIILIGEGGWVGYIGLFGLLTIPVILFLIDSENCQYDSTDDYCTMDPRNTLKSWGV
ncbi:MAG: O-antigen ligase family protein, partial [Pseudomonadota bacterium]